MFKVPIVLIKQLILEFFKNAVRNGKQKEKCFCSIF